MLRKCLSELQAPYAEATDILSDPLVARSADMVRGLCARFQVLQEYFAMRYREARTRAISALGEVNAALCFP